MSGVARAALVGLIAVMALMAAAVSRSGVPAERSAAERPAPFGPLQAAAPEPAATPSPRGAPVLLPNLRSLGAGDVHVEVVGARRRLRFAAALGNLGPGPLLVRPRDRAGQCPEGQLEALQVVHEDRNSSGVFERERDGVGKRWPTGCMLDHPGHDHWHFDAMAAYSLRRPGEAAFVRRNKVSFCLRDNRKVPDQPVVVRREHFGECTRTGPQGISPGWVDVYDSDLDGQWLRLPRGLEPGVVCLDLQADPRDLLWETDEADNGTTVALRLDGTRARRVPQRWCG